MEKLFSSALPFWSKLPPDAQNQISNSIVLKQLKQNTRLSYGDNECTGLEIIKSGQARVFIASPNGGEITLYRLTAGDLCILSAACMIKNLDFDVTMEFETDSEIYILPQNIYQSVSESNPSVRDFTLELLSSRFSDVMWIINQLVFSNLGQRLASVLMERSQLAKSLTLSVTHESIARDLGTAREVVTRLLKQFQLDGLVRLSRGQIEITNPKRLLKI